MTRKKICGMFATVCMAAVAIACVFCFAGCSSKTVSEMAFTNADGEIMDPETQIYFINEDETDAKICMNITYDDETTSTLEDYSGSKIKWSMSDEDVLTVSGNGGAISVKSQGECIVTAKIGDLSESITVRVIGEIKEDDFAIGEWVGNVDLTDLLGVTADATVTVRENSIDISLGGYDSLLTIMGINLIGRSYYIMDGVYYISIDEDDDFAYATAEPTENGELHVVISISMLGANVEIVTDITRVETSGTEGGGI